MLIHEIVKWAASCGMIIGAVFVGMFPQVAAHGAWAFTLFFIGHFVWATYAYIMKEPTLFWLNVGFLPLDTYSVYARL